MAGITPSRPGHRGLLLSATTALALFACALLAANAAAATPKPPIVTSPTGAYKPRISCPTLPPTLTSTDPSLRPTIMYRIQNQANVNTYIQPDETKGGLAQRIRFQDIFVINTRFQNSAGTSNPAAQVPLVTALRTAFPCNRIIGLNGLSADPTQPGYIYALADQGLFGLMIDWELMDWSAAQQFQSLPPFTTTFAPKSLKRINRFFAQMNTTLSSLPQAAGTHGGIIPNDFPGWDYGQVATAADVNNARLGRHAGLQSVQTQGACHKGGASGFASRLAALRDQYRFKTITKVTKKRVKGKIKRITMTKKKKIKKGKRPDLNNLSVQLSFTETPNPASALPLTAVSPQQADACLAAGLGLGFGSYFFYSSEDAMRALFAQPTLAALRPPPPPQPPTTTTTTTTP